MCVCVRVGSASMFVCACLRALVRLRWRGSLKRRRTAGAGGLAGPGCLQRCLGGAPAKRKRWWPRQGQAATAAAPAPATHLCDVVWDARLGWTQVYMVTCRGEGAGGELGAEQRAMRRLLDSGTPADTASVAGSAALSTAGGGTARQAARLPGQPLHLQPWTEPQLPYGCAPIL